jgi:hypothetical protein
LKGYGIWTVFSRMDVETACKEVFTTIKELGRISRNCWLLWFDSHLHG